MLRNNGYFSSFCPLEANLLVLGQIWDHAVERALKGLSNALFHGAVALLLPELVPTNVEKVNILPLVTFDIWPKKWPKCFVMIFDVLSNAAYLLKYLFFRYKSKWFQTRTGWAPQSPSGLAAAAIKADRLMLRVQWVYLYGNYVESWRPPTADGSVEELDCS